MADMIVSVSPHLHSKDTTRRIMLDVVIALLPALVMAVVRFGLHALALALVCVGSAVAAEALSRKIMKREQTVGDLSAVVTGLLLALNLPATLPLWMGALGSVIAIVVVKQCFGGLGQNFVNPAIAARIVLLLCFAGAMTSWQQPGFVLWNDGVTGASPLAALKEGTTEGLPALTDFLFGLRAGSMGEVCALALIAGGVYLLVRRVISPIIPLCFIGTVFAGMLLRGGVTFALYEVLSGGLLLGAIFMATDYVTSPITPWGKVIFGVGCGLITLAIRLWGSLPEGVSYAILLMNIFVPHIEKLTLPRPFGARKGGKA
ncbi:MAG: RnfABCDGE type electron transport complex subunit D [Clostridia bacterium]|nr:RnfABCDGE type electron transport complex subunit D [Clostridia bacterium]